MTTRRIELREVRAADLPVFFEHQRDPVAWRMAAFGAADPSDRAAFDAHWQRILGDADVVIRSIVVDGAVVGHVLSFTQSGQRELSYWLGRAHWGRGFATQALTLFLAEQRARPLHARAAKDNAASIGVLRRCGFTVCAEDRGFAPARGAVTDEWIFRLDR